MSDSNNNELLTELTAEIVSAYVSNNPMAADQLPSLIQSTFQTVSSLSAAPSQTTAPNKEPAVPIKKSVTNEYIICLENGKKFKSLKRHLQSRYNMTPEEYRTKWGLPVDYPMVAPGYAEKRSQLAKKMGLGKRRPE